MNNRERLVNTVLFKEVDRLPLTFYFGPWSETEKRWKSEGLGEKGIWQIELGMDPGIEIVNVNLGYSPSFEYRVVEERNDTRIISDTYGVLQEIKKIGSSIPRYIEYPVKNAADWEKLKKERLDPQDPNRFPSDWAEVVKRYNEGDKMIQLGTYPYGLFGTIRDMMGIEEFMISLYEQPELIHDMMDHLTDLWISIYEKVCCDVKVDAIHMWEDMSGKQGSLISPRMVREFMMPNYKRIKAFADSAGIPVYSLDTDGDCSELVPLFIECGINLIFPFEVAAGCDINEYRKKYPKLCIMGGIDKREIAKGKEAIDKELDRIIGLFSGTGYIAALDHLAHPDISWDDYKYFVDRLKMIIGI